MKNTCVPKEIIILHWAEEMKRMEEERVKALHFFLDFLLCFLSSEERRRRRMIIVFAAQK